MLKHRIIGAFVAVWFAVCLWYVGVRAVCGAMLGKTTGSETTATAAQTPNAPEEEQASSSATEGTQTTETTEAASIPSLSEYLSSFTCGSCRRNCSLDNPRCHNGSRLAEAKTQEYYELW